MEKVGPTKSGKHMEQFGRILNMDADVICVKQQKARRVKSKES